MPLPSMVLQMSQMIKWQRLEHAQGEPYLMQPKEKSVQGFCHLLILFPVKHNKELISLTDQHMRYASDMFACQTHKHNKICQQQRKKSPASVHGLQTATSISIKTNSSKHCPWNLA